MNGNARPPSNACSDGCPSAKCNYCHYLADDLTENLWYILGQRVRQIFSSPTFSSTAPGRKYFYLTTHSTHFIYGYMASVHQEYRTILRQIQGIRHIKAVICVGEGYIRYWIFEDFLTLWTLFDHDIHRTLLQIILN